MALKYFNVLSGLSAGNIVLDAATGNATVTNLAVTDNANFAATANVALGNVANVHITGGANGQALVTDGAGVLSFQAVSTTDRAAPMPYNIPNGESYIVNNDFQGLFAYPITIDGSLEVDGILIDVSSYVSAPNNQILFTSANYAAANTGFTFDPATGNLAVPGNITGNYIFGNGSQLTGITAAAGSNIANGTSNVSIPAANGNVNISAVGNANVLAITGTGANLVGTLNIGGRNLSQAAWTTNGIALIQAAATYTDTTSAAGTVPAVYINGLAAPTLAASNAITVTNLYSTFFSNPAAGTNVTATNLYALGADSIRTNGTFAAASTVSFSATAATLNLGGSQTTGLWTAGGTSGTGIITLGQSTANQTTNIQAGATGSGNAKTINIGTGGVSGSTTTITIGSANGTTTAINGNVGIGNTSPGQKLTVAGTIESTTGGIKFPDGTTQTTAATGGGGATGLQDTFMLMGA